MYTLQTVEFAAVSRVAAATAVRVLPAPTVECRRQEPYVLATTRSHTV